MAGLAAALELPLVIVARASLGTINHTLLSLEAARARGLRVAGVAVSHTTAHFDAAERRNLDRLLEALPAPFLGELPHGADRLTPSLDALELAHALGLGPTGPDRGAPG